MQNFLMHLATAAQSTLAFVAYLAVIIAWMLKVWVSDRPQRRAKEILALYSSDAERTRALAALLGNEPPRGLKKDEILAWVALQGKHRERAMLILVYLATLFAAIAIVGMALFPEYLDATRPPQLIESVTVRPAA